MKKPNPYAAFWYLRSFYGVQYRDRGYGIRLLFVGAHKQRNLGKLKTKPKIEDLKPKANLLVISETKEAFPFPADKIPVIISALAVINNDRSIIDRAKEIIDSIVETTPPTNPLYIERVLEDITEHAIIAKVQENGNFYNYDRVPPEARLNTIQWLHGAYSYNERISVRENVKPIGQLIAIGKDTQYNEPVIGFKKTYNNFSVIVPLVDKGMSLISSLLFIVYYRPRIYFITPEYLESQVPFYITRLYESKMSSLDFYNLSITEVIDRIKE